MRKRRAISGKSKRCLPPAGKCCDYFYTMTGAPCSTSTTGARHPNLLQQQGCRDNGDTDKLRRMAIKNSYDMCSSGGAGGGETQLDLKLAAAESSSSSKGMAASAKVLPSLAANRQLYNPHRHSSKCRNGRPTPKPAHAQQSTSTTRPRSLSAAMRIGSCSKVHPSSTVLQHDVGASAGEDPKQLTKIAAPLHALDDLKGTKSHPTLGDLTSVSLSQPAAESTGSSYIYHIPSRLIQRGRSRSQSRVHAHMHTHNVVPSLSMRRSSSHSTVALHRTSAAAHHHHRHHPSPPSSLPLALLPPPPRDPGSVPNTRPLQRSFPL